MTTSTYEIAQQLFDMGRTPANVTLTDVYNADGFEGDFQEVQKILASLIYLDKLDSVAEFLAKDLRENGVESDQVDGNLIVDMGLADELAEMIKDKM